MNKPQDSKLMRDMSEKLMDEDISILATMWVPNAEEANAITLRNMARREAIREIDEEIKDLQARRNRLVRACDIGDAIVAPIRKIPPEILVEIILLCMPSTPTTRRRRKPHRRTGFKRRPQSLRPQEVAELLGNVCRTWHMILNDDPRIWSRLVLDTKIRTPEHVNQLLKKSKSHPLDIFVQPRNWFHNDQAVDETDAVFEMLRRELWRTRSFISDMRDPWEGQGMFPPGFSINAPMMQTFNHTCPAEHDDYELEHAHCPQLQSIAFENSGSIVRSLVGHPMQAVQHLVVSFHLDPASLYLQLLSTLPNLVSLHWVNMGAEQVHVAPSTVGLQSLKSLRVHTAGFARVLLSHLYVPSLQSLELCVRDPMDAIDAICGDDTVKLTRLHLYDAELFEQDIHITLRQLDHLDTLVIENSPILDRLLTALAPRDRDFSSVCPQLTTLVITQSHIPPGPFVDFVHRRTRADWEEAVPGIVSCLKLGDGLGSSNGLCNHFACTHSETIHYMSRDEYYDMTLKYAPMIFPEGWDEAEGQGWGQVAVQVGSEVGGGGWEAIDDGEGWGGWDDWGPVGGQVGE